MSSFIANSQAYNIQAENEVAVLLSNFSTNYIFGVIQDILADRHTSFDILSKPNLVISFESNFKSALSQYPSDRNNILQVRDQTYREIIDLICKDFQMEIRYDETVDFFTTAKYIYDFFISNYNSYVSLFFSKIITREKDGIYQSLHLEETKKSKDSTTLYNKRLYNDPKIALINSNLTNVIGYITQVEFSMETILNYIYGNNVIATNLFMQHIFPQVSFFQSAYCSLLQNPALYPLVITAIRLEIQRLNAPNDSTSLQQI
jgi:hypothetical protein